MGGSRRLEPIGPNSFHEFTEQWETDPLWQSTLVPLGVELADGADAAEWPLARIRDPDTRRIGPCRVRNEVPADFDAYVRVLCPFVGPKVFENGREIGHELTNWHETALQNGRVSHRLMDVVGIGPDHADKLHGGQQPYGRLHPHQEIALSEILQDHTSSKSGWFLLWDGDYHGSLTLPDSSKVELPGTSMYFCLFHGPLTAWDGFWTLPRWSWPHDRAWCFQTNVDLDMTNCIYIGASSDCVEAILTNPILEALVAEPDDLEIGSDTINIPNPT